MARRLFAILAASIALRAYDQLRKDPTSNRPMPHVSKRSRIEPPSHGGGPAHQLTFYHHTGMPRERGHETTIMHVHPAGVTGALRHPGTPVGRLHIERW